MKKEKSLKDDLFEALKPDIVKIDVHHLWTTIGNKVTPKKGKKTIKYSNWNVVNSGFS